MKSLISAFISMYFLCLCSFVALADSTKKPPQRVISLVPSLTEEVFFLGRGKSLIANTTYCNRPAEAKLKEKVGNVINFDVEKIVALQPDLVLAAGFSNTKSLQKIKKFGIPVKIFNTPEGFKEVCNIFLELGKLMGDEKKAQLLVDKISGQVDGLKEKIAIYPRVRVFFQIGVKPLFAATKHSFTNDYIELAGGINVVRETGRGLVSREMVLSRNPQVILIADMGILGGKEIQSWKKFKTISAVQTHRIFVVDSNQFCLPSLGGFLESLQQMIRILHPQVRL